jgi:3-hydroxy-9,10-secoandrosta-1,3,5(10)-triene-9,17-dione monooxygenase
MSSDLQTVEAASTPSREELVARAAALRDQLRADAEQVDRDRDVPEANIDAVTEAGLMRMLTPRRVGGYELDTRTMLDVTRELSRGDTSTAWITGVINGSAFLLGSMSHQAQDDVWGDDPNTRVASVAAPSAKSRAVDGGLVVSGRWAYASGITHSQWFAPGVPTEDGGPMLAVFPVSDLQIEDTWFYAGIRGSASRTAIADEVFVPSHRLIPSGPLLHGGFIDQHEDEPLYRTLPSMVFILSILGPQLGVVQNAIDHLVEQAPKRGVAASTYGTMGESVPFQLAIAKADMMLQSARLLAEEMATVADAAAQVGEFPSVVERTRLRQYGSWVAQNLREAMDTLMTAYGTSSMADSSPLQRYWRDIGTGSRHTGFNLDVTSEMHGRALLGKDPAEVAFLY